jgi:hypothetical protein
MIDLSLPLIGPAAKVLATLRALIKQRESVAVLAEGNPGGGKSHLLDQLAIDLTGCEYAIEQINGQSLKLEIVRDWRERACFGNLFSDWTVKRIDELDHAGGTATAELLSYLDYLPKRLAVLATTNDYVRLRATSKGRLETRFVRVHVASPSVAEATAYLRKRFGIPKNVAAEIAKGAVPDGCLPVVGVNMRACVNDAEGFKAARAAA